MTRCQAVRREVVAVAAALAAAVVRLSDRHLVRAAVVDVAGEAVPNDDANRSRDNQRVVTSGRRVDQ